LKFKIFKATLLCNTDYSLW